MQKVLKVPAVLPQFDAGTRSGAAGLLLLGELVERGRQREQLAVWHGDIAANPGIQQFLRDSEARSKLLASHQISASPYQLPLRGAVHPAEYPIP